MDGEEITCYVIRWKLVFVLLVALVAGENDTPHDATNAVVNSEPGFVPGVQGEEYGIMGKRSDTFREESADGGGGDGAFTGGMSVEESCEELTE